MATKTSTARQSTAPARKATKARAPKKAPKKAKARAKANTLPSRAKDDFTNDMNITVLAKKNPHQTGTKGHERFGLYKKGMTVGDVLAAMKAEGLKNRRGNLRRDHRHGHIRIEGAKTP